MYHFAGKKQDKGKDVMFQESDSEQEGDDSVGSFKVDDWINFTAEDPVLYAIAMLRIKFLALFSKHIQVSITSPSLDHLPDDQQTTSSDH